MPAPIMTRNSLRAVRIVLAAVLAIAGLVVATTPSADATGTVRIRLKVSGCEGCGVSPYNFVRQAAAGTTRKVVNGIVVFTVARSATKGLGFFIANSAPNGASNYDQFIVTRYKGLIKGDPVPGYRAKNGHYATQCWAGTTRARVTLSVTVKHYATTSIYDGSPADAIRAYFNPTVASIGTPWPTVDGMLGTQVVRDCSGHEPGVN